MTQQSTNFAPRIEDNGAKSLSKSCGFNMQKFEMFCIFFPSLKKKKREKEKKRKRETKTKRTEREKKQIQNDNDMPPKKR